jgi:hypothetical protein
VDFKPDYLDPLPSAKLQHILGGLLVTAVRREARVPVGASCETERGMA